MSHYTGSPSEGGTATVMAVVPISPVFVTAWVSLCPHFKKLIFQRHLVLVWLSGKPTSISVNERSQENKYKRKPNGVIQFGVNTVEG